MSHALVLVAVDCAKQSGIEKAVAHQMEPFDENGQWFKDGSRWDWYQIGGRYSGRLLGDNIVRRGDVKRTQWEDWREKRARAAFKEMRADKSAKDAFVRSMVWGIDEKTEDEYAAKSRNIYFPAFLRARSWHENERMGWFGATASSECQIGRKEVLKGKCMVEDKESGSKIVGWNDDRWAVKYFDRFIEPLSPDTWLVAVDYHV